MNCYKGVWRRQAGDCRNHERTRKVNKNNIIEFWLFYFHLFIPQRAIECSFIAHIFYRGVDISTGPFLTFVLRSFPARAKPLMKVLDEILKCGHSNESYWAVLSCGAVYCAVQVGSNFWVCGWNPKCVTIQMKATEQYFPVVLFIVLYKVVLTFWVCGWNPKVWPLKWKLQSSTFLWCCLLCCTRWFWLLSLWMKS